MHLGLVLKNERLSSSLHSLILKVEPSILENFKPGQFLKLKLNPTYDPLLPRPFTVHTIGEDSLEILYQVVGKGTFLLSKLREGDEVEFYGPLGKPFPVLPNPYLICAGGVGVAGFGFLCQGLRKDFPLPTKLLYGAKTKEQLVKLDFFSNLIPLSLATDDGSFGFRGTIVELLQEELFRQEYRAILACGPKTMLRQVAEVGQGLGIKTYLLLETLLACGTGLCLGCAIPKRQGGNFKLCLDGPTFAAEEIDLAFLS